MNQHFENSFNVAGAIVWSSIVLAITLTILPSLGEAADCRLLKSSEEQEFLLLGQLNEADTAYQKLTDEYRHLLTKTGAGDPADNTSNASSEPTNDWQSKAQEQAAELLAADPAIMAFKRQMLIDAALAKRLADRRLTEYRLIIERGRLQAELEGAADIGKRFEIQKQISIVSSLIEKNCYLAGQDGEIADLEQFYVHDSADRVNSKITPTIRAAIGGAEVYYFGFKRLPRDWRRVRQYQKWRSQNRFLLGQDKDFNLALMTGESALLRLKQKQLVLDTLDRFWQAIRVAEKWPTALEGEDTTRQMRRIVGEYLDELGSTKPPVEMIDEVLKTTGFEEGIAKIDAALKQPVGDKQIAAWQVAASDQLSPVTIEQREIERALQIAERPPSVNYYTERSAAIANEEANIRAELKRVVDAKTKSGMLERLDVLKRERAFIDNVIGDPNWFRRSWRNLGTVAVHSLLVLDALAIAHGAVTAVSDLNLLRHWMFGDAVSPDADNGLTAASPSEGFLENYADIYWNYQKDDDGLWKYWEIKEPLRMPYIVASLSNLGNRQLSIVRIDQNIATTRETLSAAKRDWLKVEVLPLFEPNNFVPIGSK